MNTEIVTPFKTDSRIHVGLAVKNLENSIAFYSTLFGQPPAKTRQAYAKFELSEPPVNLSLNEVGGATGPNNPVAHFGIQLKSSHAVAQFADRVEQAGLEVRIEQQVTCCYAVQDKVWVSDPDGNNWEVYVVLDDDAHQHASSHASCCTGISAVMQAVKHGDLVAAQQAFQMAGGMTACSCLDEVGE